MHGDGDEGSAQRRALALRGQARLHALPAARQLLSSVARWRWQCTALPSCLLNTTYNLQGPMAGRELQRQRMPHDACGLGGRAGLTGCAPARPGSSWTGWRAKSQKGRSHANTMPWALVWRAACLPSSLTCRPIEDVQLGCGAGGAAPLGRESCPQARLEVTGGAGQGLARFDLQGQRRRRARWIGWGRGVLGWGAAGRGGEAIAAGRACMHAPRLQRMGAHAPHAGAIQEAHLLLWRTTHQRAAGCVPSTASSWLQAQ